MKPIKLALPAVLLIPALLWLLADSLLPSPFTYFSFRPVFMQFSGVIAIAAMSIAMVLATRPRWLEPHLNGLDKMYRLHKWLGISALVAAVLHWWWAQGTRWMVGWGWLVRPPRGPRPPEDSLGLVEGFFRGQRELAETMGEWAFYAAALLIVLALVKRFPYHLFAKTHTLLAVAYGVLAWHSLVLLRFEYWSQPVGWLVGALLLAGCVAVPWVLLGKVGASRKVGGTIASLEHHPDMQVLAVGITLDEGWPGHRAGQFAFATSDPAEGAHPYTIASAWDARTRHILFITKALGDHTRRLPQRLKPGMPVTVEGPYGCFDFEDRQRRQIWIGAGIGITPFVGRMKALAQAPDGRVIDLFHPTRDINDAVRDKLAADVAASKVALHLLVDERDGLLDGARIRGAVPDWREASVWFCGPPALGALLRKDFLAHGLPAERFHQELFQMR